MADSESEISMRGAIDFALAAIKGLYLLNGGGVLALLTFIGNQSLVEEVAADLVLSIEFFVCGLVAVSLGSMTAYFAQNQITKNNPSGEGWLTWLSAFLVIGSLAMFASGALIGATALDLANRE